MMSGFLDPKALVLVVVMKNPRDLEIARLLGWYRIPLQSAPKVIGVDYLAFYQTAAFGDEKSRIRYIAKINGYELATRAELIKDEPNHPRASHEYYKIQIGPLEELTNPIPAVDWHRITFLYTTGEYLLGARTVNDLILQSGERSMLWRALKERAASNQEYLAVEAKDPELDPAILAALLGMVEAGQ